MSTINVYYANRRVADPGHQAGFGILLELGESSM